MPQAPPYATLHEMLESELECCGALAQVLERERVAASAQNLEALLASNKDREAIQARWLRLAGARRSWLHARGLSLGEMCAKDESLSACRAELELRSEQLQRGQRVNGALVSAVLGQVSGLIDTFRRGLPSSQYDQAATLTSSVPRRGGVAFSV